LKPENVIRSIAYIEESAHALLSVLRSKYYGVSSFIEDQDFASFWKYYKELIPFLQQFAKGNGSQGRLAVESAIDT